MVLKTLLLPLFLSPIMEALFKIWPFDHFKPHEMPSCYLILSQSVVLLMNSNWWSSGDGSYSIIPNLKYMLIISRCTFSRSMVCLMNLASWLGSCCCVTGSTCSRLPDHVCMLVVFSPGESESFPSASFTPLRRRFTTCWKVQPNMLGCVLHCKDADGNLRVSLPTHLFSLLRIDSVSSLYWSGHRTFLHGWFVSHRKDLVPFTMGKTLEHSQMSKILK